MCIANAGYKRCQSANVGHQAAFYELKLHKRVFPIFSIVVSKGRTKETYRRKRVNTRACGALYEIEILKSARFPQNLPQAVARERFGTHNRQKLAIAAAGHFSKGESLKICTTL